MIRVIIGISAVKNVIIPKSLKPLNQSKAIYLSNLRQFADFLHPLFLQHPQQFGLGLERQFSDFIQKKVPLWESSIFPILPFF